MSFPFKHAPLYRDDRDESPLPEGVRAGKTGQVYFNKPNVVARFSTFASEGAYEVFVDGDGDLHVTAKAIKPCRMKMDARVKSEMVISAKVESVVLRNQLLE